MSGEYLSSAQCIICYEPYSEQRPAYVPPCGHMVCGECLEQTYRLSRDRRTCPTCRVKLPTGRHSCIRLYHDFVPTQAVGLDREGAIDARIVTMRRENEKLTHKLEMVKKHLQDANRALEELESAQNRTREAHRTEVRGLQTQLLEVNVEKQRNLMKIQELESEIGRLRGELFLNHRFGSTNEVTSASDSSVNQEIDKMLDGLTAVTLRQLAKKTRLREIKQSVEIADLKRDYERITASRERLNKKCKEARFEQAEMQTLRAHVKRLQTEKENIAVQLEHTKAQLMLEKQQGRPRITLQPSQAHEQTADETAPTGPLEPLSDSLEQLSFELPSASSPLLPSPTAAYVRGDSAIVISDSEENDDYVLPGSLRLAKSRRKMNGPDRTESRLDKSVSDSDHGLANPFLTTSARVILQRSPKAKVTTTSSTASAPRFLGPVARRRLHG